MMISLLFSVSSYWMIVVVDMVIHVVVKKYCKSEVDNPTIYVIFAGFFLKYIQLTKMLWPTAIWKRVL